MNRHGLTDAAWSRLAPWLPSRSRLGRPAADPRLMLEGALWVLHTGAPWRDLPGRFGPWQTVYGRFRAWARSGVLESLIGALQRELARSGKLELGLWCVDTTVIRATRAAGGARPLPGRGEPADHALGRSRGGFGTKLSLVCDAGGVPLAVALAPGQSHDIRSLSNVMSEALRVGRPSRLAADKGYSFDQVRAWLRERGVEPVIPTRRDQPVDSGFDPAAYRQRNVVERLVAWLKESRRVATRYEKLALHYLAMVHLAVLRRLLRVADFRDKP